MHTPRIKIVAVLSFVTLTLALLRCTKDHHAIGNNITISSITPDKGFPGTEVTITGTGFSSLAGTSEVYFNGLSSTISNLSETSLKATVPVGATPGKVTVKIGNQSVQSAVSFEVLQPAQVISSFSPGYGEVGSTVTIAGTGFSTSANLDEVYFNGVRATVTTATETSLTVTVPSGATSGKLTVTIAGYSVQSAGSYELLQPNQTITSFAPARGLTGTTVTISGSGFETFAKEINKVYFNGVSTPVLSATSTSLVVSVPQGATSGKLTVTIGSLTVESTQPFEVIVDIPRDGLVAFYPFSGNTKDAGTNMLDGVAMNGPALAEDRFHVANQAYSFDGVDDFITMGNPVPLQLHGSFTISGWFNLKDVTTDHTIVSKAFDNPAKGYNTTQGYILAGSPLGANAEYRLFQTIFSSVGTSTQVDQFINYYTTPIVADQWYFFAMVIDSKSFKIYLNGSLSGSFSMPSEILPDGTNGDFIIGSHRNAYCAKGFIDDVAVYNRALSEAEITQLYQQTITK